MSEADPVRLRYLADAVATATPAQRVVMLYDRLLTDIERALAEFGTASTASTHTAAASAHLRHAQLIVAELWGSLDSSAWNGADNLAGLYGFLVREFVEIDRSGDAGKLVAARAIVRALRTSWSEAADQLASDGSGAATAGAGAAVSAPFAHSAASASRGAAVATRAAFIPAAVARPVSAGSWIS